jgi:LL-diaminopimelate aminotransferase
MRRAARLDRLPPYLFAELDQKIERCRKAGKDVISFGVGDPDLPTPEHIVQACCDAARDPKNHRYPTYQGMRAFREAVAGRYRREKDVALDPEKEVIALIGSKEGVHNIHFAFVEPGDTVLYTDPGYPVYRTGSLFAGGEAYPLPLEEDRSFLPSLEAVPEEVLRRTKLLWINYPNNPTAATAGKGFYREAIDLAEDWDFLLCSDEAYSGIAFDGYRPISLLEVEGGREVGVVFDSLSKTYNMTGWRIAYAVGNSEAIAALGKVKTNIDSGASQIIQEAGIAALTASQVCVEGNVRIYKERRDLLYEGLRTLGLEGERPKATFYLWMKAPGGDSLAFAERLLEETAVVCTPGIGFGEHGEGYVRFALTQPTERIAEALDRMEKAL